MVNRLFWKDVWLGEKPICLMVPVLFDRCKQKDITIHKFLTLNGQVKFDRWLPPCLFEQWVDVVNQVYNFPFKSEDDVISWKWGGKGRYNTKSAYDHLSVGEEGLQFQHIWKSKTPYKIKNFTWLLENNAILTRDNMVKRKWNGDPSCCFCNQMETVEHLFFQCSIAKCIWGMVGICLGSKCIPSSIAQYKLWIQKVLPQGKAVHHFGFSAICWATWKSRNKVVFDKKMIKHPAEIVYTPVCFCYIGLGYSIRTSGGD
jgi:hypothetical protein